MDADSNGSIDQAELKAAFMAVGVNLTAKEVKNMLNEADEDGCVRRLALNAHSTGGIPPASPR